jgi:hypothetical protein
MWAIAEWLDAIPKQERAGTSSIAPTAADIAAPGTNPAYVAKAIRAELERLASTREGGRNATLFRVACRVFEFVKGGHADETAARAELTRIATDIGLEPYEIENTIKSAWGTAELCNVPARSAVQVAEVTCTELQGGAA